MYSLIWWSVIWRPGKGRLPHWREEARSTPGQPRPPDGALLTALTVPHPDCRASPSLIAARHPDRAPRPLCRLPAGRGGGAARPVRRDLAPDRPLARTARG